MKNSLKQRRPNLKRSLRRTRIQLLLIKHGISTRVALYYQGNYAEARTQFQQIIAEHQPENQIESLYAQKAIGNTYEQEGDYEKAIEAYQAKSFPATPQLSPEIRN